MTSGLASGLQAKLFTQGADAVTAHQKALGVIYRSVEQQSSLLAYADNFRLIAVMALLCIPLLLFFKQLKKHD
jgi:hypothetical protein